MVYLCGARACTLCASFGLKLEIYCQDSYRCTFSAIDLALRTFAWMVSLRQEDQG